MALYSRKELNLRLISNLLLAIASSSPRTSFYLKKYFSATVLLPSDWIMIANLFLTVNKRLPTGSLPAALRRAMKEKFPEFDEHQLGKYNKSLKGPSMEGVETEEEREEIMRGRDYDLKRLVRLLHLSEPADLVLAILEKKYPEDKERFRQSRLEGMFDPSRAGKRMKLKTPVTWETQISLRGNKPEVWQQLIDERKLPYMATVRNIRNLLLSGISEAHVKKVCSYISNETAVTKSRMFPFQFFTAYDVLSEVKQIKEDGGNERSQKRQGRKKPDSEEKEKWMIAKEKKRNAMIQGINLEHIDTLKVALDKAVNISARKNIPPLKGTTLILCAYGNDLNRRFTEAKGVSQKGATVRDATALFSLMCSQACEDSRLVFFSANHLELEPPGRDILSNVEFVKIHTELNKKVGVLTSTRGCTAALEEYLEQEKFFDNIIIFQADEENYSQTYEVVRLYRKYINKDLLFAMVNVCGRPSCSSDDEELFTHQNDLNIRGFSDSVFKLIVNKGNGGQLEAVERIDRKHNLIKLPSPLLQSRADTEQISPSLEIPLWQQVRVFVSSTFLDMEAERNILHHWVLPQLQRRAAQRFISVDLIDLRWGLAADQLRTKNEVELCLEQIRRCDLFIGILGERYGWVPPSNILESISPDYRSVLLDTCQGSSITEMEMRFGVLNTVEKNRDRSFFYFRTPEVVAELDAKFVSEEADDVAKLNQLKNTIRHSGLEVMENYSATVRDGRIAGLEEFGARVLSNLCNALDKLFPSLSITESGKYEEELRRQKAFCNKVAAQFVSRTKLRHLIQEEVGAQRSGVLSLTGPPGAGISSLLATVAASLHHSRGVLTLPFFSLAEDQLDTKYLLQFIIHHLGGTVKTDENSVQSLSVVLQQSLEHFSLTNRRVVIVLDCLEKASDAADVCWFPEHIPDNCLFLVKSLQGSKLNSLLKKQKANKEILVKQLDVKERNEICREVLKRRGKSLEESAFNNQLMSLVGKRGAGSPSYLMLAIDQISKEANFDNLNEEIRQLGSTLTEINHDILMDCEQVFGVDFVKLVMIFLNQSLEGLSKTQITTVCSFYHHLLHKNWKQTGVEKLLVEFQIFKTTNGNFVSLMDISMCVERLAPCLQNTRDVLRILNNITPVVQERYLKKCQSSTLLEINAILAVLHLDNYSNDVVQPAGLLSLTHHLGVCGDIKLLKTTVCSPKFIQAKSSLGQGSQLAREYLGKSLRFKSGQEKFRRDPLVQEYQRFVKNNLETIKHKPYLLPQVILNEPQDSVIKKSANCDQPEMTTLRWDNGPKTVRESCAGGQTVISNARNPATFILPSDKVVLTGYSDGSILVSEADTFEDLFCLVGHSDSITGLGELGKTVLVSGSSDGLLASWDLEQRIRLASVRAHERRLASLAVRLPNILTASWDGTVKVWSKALVNISTINTPSPLNCLLLHPRKDSAITGGWDSNIRVWDLQTLKQKAVMRGHNSSVQSVRLSPDCRKIISGSLDGTVKLWDSRTGAEVASFPTRPGLSHLAVEEGEVSLAHSDGLLTSWPLALGRAISTTPAREMLCPMFSRLAPGELPLLEPSSLSREVTALHDLPQLSLLIVGFANGDLQRKEKDGSWRGWKVFESKVDLIGSELDMDLYTEESQMDVAVTEDSDSDCDSVTSDWNFPADMSLFDDSLTLRKTPENVLTVWLVSGPRVVLSTFHGTDLVATFALGNIRTNVVDLKILHKEIILVFTQSGFVYVYNSSDCASVSHNILSPSRALDTKHGVLTAVAFSEPESEVMVSVGSDGKARCWSYSLQGKTFSLKQLSESSPFTSKPVGVALTKQRHRDVLLVAFEDGTLALVQMGKDFLSFSSPVLVGGNGHGVKRMTSSGDYLLMVHTDGPVSLWSQSGCEISQYSQGFSAALLSEAGESAVLVLARTDLQLVCPTQSECRAAHSGHQGAVTALAVWPGGLLSGARDGKVKRWERRPGGGAEAETIVAVIASPVILSLSKSGKLALWLRAEQRVELRQRVDLGGERYEMMSAALLPTGEILLATVEHLGHVKVWQLLLTPTSFRAVLRAELQLGLKVLRLDTRVEQSDGSFSMVVATERMAQLLVLSCLEVRSTRKYRIVVKKTFPVYSREHEMETEATEYLDFINRQGPVRLFKTKYVIRAQAGPTVHLRALEDGRIELSHSGLSQAVSYQAHHQEVTDIKMTSQQELLTISLDGTIKVWRLNWLDLELSQTGEFSGLGPGLTCLHLDLEDNLVVGDQAGNLLCLAVITGRRGTPPSPPASAGQSKSVLGLRLFPLVEELCPGRADKITERLLQLDHSEIHRLIESRVELTDKVLEATRVLQDAETNQQSDSESEDLQTWCSEELMNC